MKKTLFIRILCFITALLFIFAAASCGKTDEAEKTEEKKDVQKLIEEIVVDYASYGNEADKRIASLFDELEKADEDAAERWKKIIDVWKNKAVLADSYPDVLPDGLPETDELCIVALGFQLSPDGSMRDELVERLKVVKASADKYKNAFVVCTGGGTAAENNDVTEAGEMAKWLIANGVEQSRIIVENKSMTTAQNAIFTYDILADNYPQVSKIAIVSSDYHIPTGVLLFEAESILRSEKNNGERIGVVSCAAWKAPSGILTHMFQAGALIELSGDKETAFEIYYDNYDIHELPPID